MTAVEIHKFGGTSVGNAERILAAARLIAKRRADRPADHGLVVVASAMAGVTNDLLATAARAAANDPAWHALDANLRDKHLHAVQQLLALGARFTSPGHDGIDDLLDLAHQRLAGVAATAELTARTRDAIVATGEKLAVRLLAAALRALNVPAIHLDADRFLDTASTHGEADPLTFTGDPHVAASIMPHLEQQLVPVVTGFIGRGPDGATTTLGRGGSDFTATLVAAALDAQEVVIWTDVSGVYTADPRAVPDARPIDHLNYREAAEMAYYGAKVLHPRTMIPIVAKGIPVRVKNTLEPAHPGTLIDRRFVPGPTPVKAVTAIRGQALVSVEGSGMVGVPGVAARVFTRLANAGLSVTMISQSSSESSICLAIPAASARAADLALRQEFRAEITSGWIEDVRVEHGIALLAAVGIGMQHRPGVAGTLFTALGHARVSARAIAQGSSELNLSFAVADEDADLALRTIHAAFLPPRATP